MSNKFRVYRKRLDFIHFRIDTSFEGEDGSLVEEEIVLLLRRPDTVQALQLTESIMRLGRSIDIRSELFKPEDYATSAAGFFEFVHDIQGLKDEDDTEIVWSSLSAEEKSEILASLPMSSVFQLGNHLIEAGRLSPDKKKRSVSTSPTSTPEAPAAVPSVPAE